VPPPAAGRSPTARPPRYLSLFHYYAGRDPLTRGVDIGGLAIAGGELAHGPAEVGIEALDQRVTHAPVNSAPQLGQVVEYGPSR